jgi:hypothetical protein
MNWQFDSQLGQLQVHMQLVCGHDFFQTGVPRGPVQDACVGEHTVQADDFSHGDDGNDRDKMIEERDTTVDVQVTTMSNKSKGANVD